MSYLNYVLVISLSVIFLSLILAAANVDGGDKKHNSSEYSMNRVGDKKHNSSEYSMNRVKEGFEAAEDGETDSKNITVIKGARGPEGPEGPMGPVGPSGGVYQSRGYLLNHQFLDQPITRQPGKGKSTNLFMQMGKGKTPFPWNIFTHQSNGLIQSDQGECIWGDAGSGNVYMDSCNSTDPQNQWNFNQKLAQYQWAKNPAQCLSLKQNARSLSGMGQYQTDGTVKGASPGTKTMDLLTLSKCSSSWNEKEAPNQQFYIL